MRLFEFEAREVVRRAGIAVSELGYGVRYADRSTSMHEAARLAVEAA